jgi:hypothetical protein
MILKNPSKCKPYHLCSKGPFKGMFSPGKKIPAVPSKWEGGILLKANKKPFLNKRDGNEKDRKCEKSRH